MVGQYAVFLLCKHLDNTHDHLRIKTSSKALHHCPSGECWSDSSGPSHPPAQTKPSQIIEKQEKREHFLWLSFKKLVEDHLPAAGGVPSHRPRLDGGLTTDPPVLVRSLKGIPELE